MAAGLLAVGGAGCVADGGGVPADRIPDSAGLAPAAMGDTAPAPGAAPEPETVRTPPDAFVVKPYLQLGNVSGGPAPTERLDLLWHAAPDVPPGDGGAGAAADAWRVELRPSAAPPGAAAWRPAPAPSVLRTVAVRGVAPHRVWRATLAPPTPGAWFDYRVLRNGVPVFAARARAPKAPGAPIRFVVFGDAGAGTGGQKAVAYRTFQAGPDFVVITGDVVYDRGRIGEYRRRFFPVYNADHAGPRLGAPLLRSTLFVAVPGNHDLSYSDLGRYPDGLAYFLYWNPPGNGPVRHHGAPSSPPLRGNAAAQGAFLAAAGPAFPRAANFSFRYGDAHWVVLDGNPHVRWNDPDLRAWVERELRDAQTAAWRFVAVHHPGFHSSRTHFRQQQMRLLADVFERGRVDIVFSGHVHNYQRSLPLRFAGERRSGEEGDFVQRRTGEVPGRWTLDRRFDGRTVTRPDGVLYVVSGAGGGGLYNRDQEADPGSWQPFTARYVAGTHSLTVVDLEGKRLVLRQISATGEELDRIVVSK